MYRGHSQWCKTVLSNGFESQKNGKETLVYGNFITKFYLRARYKSSACPGI